MIDHIRNIGIFAHVDAGKTTLTEQLLLATGAIRRAGRVDEGTAHTDSLPVERARGISVRAGTVCVRHGDTLLRVIDTPGHVDFSPEVETALLAVDGAVLVVSAVEGVQAQTAVICRVLNALGIPTLIFINKLDRAGADAAKALGELATLLPRPILIKPSEATLTDELTALDDELLALALEGRADAAALEAAMARATRARRASPALTGSALKGTGIGDALEGIIRFLPPPEETDALSIAAYNVRREGGERRVSVRVFGGELRAGAVPVGASAHEVGKVKRLLMQTPEGEKTVGALKPGDIGIAVGLEGLRAGMWLGERTRGTPAMAAPVLRAQVLPEREAELPALLRALEALGDEHGSLRPTFEPRSRKMHIQVMGEIHQQVIEQTLLDGYGLKATLEPPEVLYRETPCGIGEGGFNKMMDPWKARATFRVQPGARGSGVRFLSQTHVDVLPAKYQRQIEAAVYPALAEGLHGWPVTDIEVYLTGGHGSWRRWDGDSSFFGPVVPLGLFAALKDAGTMLLEPMLRFEAAVDENAMGALLYELSLIRAVCEPVRYAAGSAHVEGLVPVETSQRFAAKVAELSRGRGVWRTRLEGYHPAPPGCGRDIERTTPDPCNEALYMDFIIGRVTSINN